MAKSHKNFNFYRVIVLVVGTWLMGASMAQDVVSLPAEIDRAMTEKIWVFIKQETQAPENLPLPPILFDEKIPKEARMMFQFPSEDAPDNNLQISIGTRGTYLWKQEMFLWALGHELTHYAFLMQENQWQQKPIYDNNIRHHCNVEFMRVTRDIVEIIWEQYQSVVNRMRMYNEVFKSCARQPLQ
jgi:hypothetical protein